ncbi:MAG: flavodoxin family protein [Syntrophaceae bacterium]
MKALVTYYSETGNTEALARAIYDAIHIEKEIKPVKDVQSTKGYDIIFCGFPCHAHSVPGKAISLIKGLPEGQKIAFFSTHGSLRGGQLPKQAFEHAIGLASKAKILGHFGCQGKVDRKLIDALSTKPEHRAWVDEALSADGHPDQHDLADGKKFAAEMLAKLTK